MGAVKRTIHQNYRAAVHEAGHAAAALAVGVGIESIDINYNAGDREGYIRFDETDVLFNASDFDILTYTVAGTCAERKWYRDKRKLDGDSRNGSDSADVKQLLSRYRARDRDLMLADAEKRADKALRYNSHIFDRFREELLKYRSIDKSTINFILKHNKIWKV